MVSTTTKSSGTATIGNEVKLASLQDRCKRDPDGYREDYDAQVRRLQSEVDILRLSPTSYNPTHTNLTELIQFAAAVSSSSYKGVESDRITSLLMNLLTGSNIVIDTQTAKSQKKKGNCKKTKKTRQNSMSNTTNNQGNTNGPSAAFLTSISASASYIGQLHKDVRRACVSALILMRNKGVLPSLTLLELFFQLLSTVPDKTIRETCYKHLVNDIRNQNKNSANEHLNRTVQGFLHKVIVASNAQHSREAVNESPADIAARKAVDMVCDLYRRKIWTDERTVSILASAVESPITNVMVRAMRFFLNIEDYMAQDRENGIEEDWGAAQHIQMHKHSGKTKVRDFV
jgi:protein SDA1